MSDLHQPQFQNPYSAREYLEAQVWPNGPVCPHCGAMERMSKIAGGRAGLWFCGHCRKQYSVTVGSLFERSKIPLHKWLLAVHLLCASKKGMSSHQLHRMIGVTYKTAWFMTHRIREAFKASTSAPPLGSSGKIVEIDETFYGKIPGATRPKVGGGGHHKHKILSLVERNGDSLSFHVANIDAKTLTPILVKHVAKDAQVFTDSAGQYRSLKTHFATHESVNHLAGEYVRGNVHTNTVESSFSLLKRGLYGTYHHVSEAHLHRYVTEFAFRFGHRKSAGFTDAQRADEALKRIKGKRLTYRRINAPA